jgi:hypothetical protein
VVCGCVCGVCVCVCVCVAPVGSNKFNALYSRDIQ